jgi:hypothetical protein
MNETARATANARTGGNFNFHKLQAVACITCSAAVSIGLIYWAVKAFF